MRRYGYFVLFGFILIGCTSVGCQRSEVQPSDTTVIAVQESQTPTEESDSIITKDKAFEIAKDLAIKEGFDLTKYDPPTCELSEEGDVYFVRYQISPPTPPGGHFNVWIDVKTGEAELMKGE